MTEPMSPATEVSSALDRRAEVLLPVLREVLAQRGRFTLHLRGNSMLPTLPEECEITVTPIAASTRPGQLIVFATGDSLVAHRLVRCTEEFWIAQGDSRRVADAPLAPDHVLGLVDAAHVDGRQVWPKSGERWRVPFWLARYHILRTTHRAARPLRTWLKRWQSARTA